MIFGEFPPREVQALYCRLLLEWKTEVYGLEEVSGETSKESEARDLRQEEIRQALQNYRPLSKGGKLGFTDHPKRWSKAGIERHTQIMALRKELEGSYRDLQEREDKISQERERLSHSYNRRLSEGCSSLGYKIGKKFKGRFV